ncbi:MAG: hypothetical protein QOD10_5780, partial [Mycobacterium sp.]|nr:hypothetical protein [Mycobacterium sp.]
EALAAEQAERGRIPVVVIDEAHLLDNAQMEAIRMLTLSRAGDYPERPCSARSCAAAAPEVPANNSA